MTQLECEHAQDTMYHMNKQTMQTLFMNSLEKMPRNSKDRFITTGQI